MAEEPVNEPEGVPEPQGPPRMYKGPSEVLRALSSGDRLKLAEALTFQRESFKAAFGCYPEDLIEIDGGTDHDQSTRG